MTLLRKYGIPLLVTVLLLGLLLHLGLGFLGDRSRDRYYRRWVMDEAGLLSAQTVAELTDFNHSLDETYGSVVGVITLENLEGNDIGQAAILLAQDYGFGQNDILLVLSRDEKIWYMDFGNVMAHYANNDLRQIAADHLPGVFSGGADEALLSLLRALQGWYGENVPIGSVQYGRQRNTSGKDVVGGLFTFALCAFSLITLLRYLIYPMFRFSSAGSWVPLWGWHILGPFCIKKRRK